MNRFSIIFSGFLFVFCSFNVYAANSIVGSGQHCQVGKQQDIQYFTVYNNTSDLLVLNNYHAVIGQVNGGGPISLNPGQKATIESCDIGLFGPRVNFHALLYTQNSNTQFANFKLNESLMGKTNDMTIHVGQSSGSMPSYTKNTATPETPCGGDQRMCHHDSITFND